MAALRACLFAKTVKDTGHSDSLPLRIRATCRALMSWQRSRSRPGILDEAGPWMGDVMTTDEP